MGRATSGTAPIAFTPDGTVGIAVQDDGSLGVFRFESNGAVTVLQPAFAGGFYAEQVLIDPTGGKAWVLDFDTVGNGGGLYEVNIHCDGTLATVGKVLAGSGAAAGARFSTSSTRLLVAASALGASPAPADAHVVELSSTPPSLVSSAPGFPDTDAIASCAAISSDDAFAAVADNGFLAGSRVAVFAVDAGVLSPRQVLSTPNPGGVAFSPFGRNGLVVNTDTADHYRPLVYNPANAAAPYTVGATLTYAFGRPQLPGAPVVLTRGQLTGRVFIAELDSVRQLQFQRDGGITDVSKTPGAGTSNGQILGSLGVQP
jgi:hypothetical protein